MWFRHVTRMLPALCLDYSSLAWNMNGFFYIIFVMFTNLSNYTIKYTDQIYLHCCIIKA